MPHQATAGSTGPDESTDSRTIRDRVSDRVDSARDGLESAAWQASFAREAVMSSAPSMETTDGATRTEAAITGTFNAMVAAAVTLIVGIYVFSQIASTMPTPENAALANATDTVKSTTGDAFTLGAVAVIVLVAALILSLIGSGFGGGGGGRRR